MKPRSAFTRNLGAPTMLVSVALALLLLPRGAKAAELLADVLAGRSVSLRDECKAALVSTRNIV
jgi:hypothetical protein